jgi:hypothetical protein
MNLETNIKDIITKKLEEGIIEKAIEEQLEKAIQAALKDVLGSYGEVTRLLEKKVKSVMVPYLEQYDYSEYIVKLDDVLTDILKRTTMDNKAILKNFQSLMNTKAEKEIKVSDLFRQWQKYVAEHVETDELEVDYDDGVSYESVAVSMEVEQGEDRSWSIYNNATLVFECEHDEDMNFAVSLSRWKDSSDEGWDMEYKKSPDLSSLRKLKEFEILLMNYAQNGTKLILDETYKTGSVRPEKEPEASFS